MSCDKIDFYICYVKMWKILLSLHVSTHWKLLMWKAYHNAFSTRSNRHIRNIGHWHECPMCQSLEGSMHDLFRNCWFSKLLGWASPLAIIIDANPMVPWAQWICDWVLLLSGVNNLEWKWVVL